MSLPDHLLDDDRPTLSHYCDWHDVYYDPDDGCYGCLQEEADERADAQLEDRWLKGRGDK